MKQRAADDPNLHYLDGRDLYGEADYAELPLPDELHPDAATHRRIGERFAALAFGAGGRRSRAERKALEPVAGELVLLAAPGTSSSSGRW